MAHDNFKLPDDVLNRIISYVPISRWSSLESVDKAFQRNFHRLWRKIKIIRFDQDLSIDRSKLNFDAKQTMSPVLEKLIRRAPNIRSISGLKIFQIDLSINRLHRDFFNLITQFKYLESLDMTNIFDNVLAELLETPEIRGRLKKLKLAKCWRSNYRNDSRVLVKAFGDQPNLPPLRLEKLWLAASIDLWDFYEAIDATNLTVLIVTDVRYQGNETVKFIDRYSSRLQRLELSFNRHESCDDQRLADATDLLMSVAKCKNLSILKINGGKYVWDGCAIYLRTLSRDLGPVFVDCIRRLGAFGRLTELSLLDYQFCDENVIAAITNCLPNLIALELYVDRCSINSISDLLLHLNRLKKLRLNDAYLRRRFINTDMMKTFVKNQSDLEHLDLTYSPFYPKMEIDLCRLKKLRALSFEGHEIMGTMSSWIDIFGSKLESLELRGVFYEEFECHFLPIIRKISNLRRLRLVGWKISNACLKEIAFGCPNLEEITLTFCRNVSVSGVQAIIDECPNLKRLIGMEKEFYNQIKLGKYRRLACD